MNIRARTTVMALLLCAGAVCAQAKTCTAKEAQAADAAVDGLSSWSAVEQNFRRYGHCDDGSIAEGTSEAIARLLVDHWTTLADLGPLIKARPALRGYVLRHVNASLNTQDLEHIASAASRQCPAGLTPLCAELKTAAQRAMR